MFFLSTPDTKMRVDFVCWERCIFGFPVFVVHINNSDKKKPPRTCPRGVATGRKSDDSRLLPVVMCLNLNDIMQFYQAFRQS